MSGPQRSLHNRPLPPLIPTNGGPVKNTPNSEQSNQSNTKTSANQSKQMANHTSKTSSKLTADMVSIYLRENPNFLEKYILENVPRDEVKRWASIQHQLAQDKKQIIKAIDQEKQKESNNLSPTKASLQMRPSTSTRKALMERSRLLRALTKDMNIRTNKARILSELKDCIAAAVNADGANLHLVDETEKLIYYYSPEEDNYCENSPCIKKIGSGSTLAAFVAQSREPIRLADINTDERFPDGLPISSNVIQSVMAQPILKEDGRVAGVIELYRTIDKPIFLSEHEEVMSSYLVWGGIAVICSEMYHRNIKQQQLNQFILEVTQSMFGKFKSMDYVIKDIMKHAKELVKADRASLFMVDRYTNELYSSIFDTGSYDKCEFVTKDVVRFPMDKGISGFVATTGETCNICDAYKDPRFNREIDQQTGYLTKNILSMPVKLQEEIIGVVMMLNKVGGIFSKEDEDHFKTFATYCGLALHIAKMYEKIRRSEQKYKVALEVLSYHSQYNQDEFQKLKAVPVPKEIPGIDEFYYSPWSIDEFHKPLSVMYMFADLFGMHCFDFDTLAKFTLTVRKNYRAVPYHNWAHAFSVAHAMYTILKNSAHQFTREECLALFVGSLCHDLDHRGKTNQYMIQSASPLSAIYSTSTMEHHHFKMSVSILQRSGHNIFKHLSSDTYKLVLGNIKHCILATDLAKFFEYKVRLESILSTSAPDWNSEEHRLVVMAVSMTSCDLCSMYKPWDIQLGLVMVIMEEFWIQGDEEKLQGQTPNRMMDRDYKHELPESQMGFIKGICLPCYSLITRIFPECEAMVKGAQSNLKEWESIASMESEAKLEKLKELELNVRSGKTILNMT